LNAYADLSPPGVDETSPTIVEFDPTDEAMAYGGNKASCERLVQARFGERSTILRPGIIVGPWDYTGRFAYWPRRALHGGSFVVPAPASRPLQFIDARDLAAFAARAMTHRIAGVYNAAGPRKRFSLGELAQTCVAAAAERGIASNAIYADGSVLVADGIVPWTDIPLWLEEPAFAGLFDVENREALAAGLQLRAPMTTVRSVMDWLSQPDSASAASPGLSFERESEIMKKV
jgi:2'-hydroxyisoflavone reductase